MSELIHAVSTVPGWQDVTPIPQDDGPNPVVAIAYPDSFRELMDLFRAVILCKEYSQRVLDLTRDILERNAGNYTVWQYRRECLVAMGVDLSTELDYMDSYAVENPKNYQIWYHRRVIVMQKGDASRELAFCSEVLDEDAKNYHAWAHRQWVLNTYAADHPQWWAQEMELVENLIALDVRNNSAWNQRWMVVHKRTDVNRSDTVAIAETLLAEVQWTCKSIGRVKLNESSWNYLRGLWEAHYNEFAGVKQAILEFCETSAQDESFEKNYFLFSLLADIKESLGACAEAKEYLQRLTVVDTLRVKYWRKRVAEVEARCQSS